MKRFGLLPRLIAAILLGIFIGMVSPQWVIKITATFNSIFGNFLGFVIPLIIIGFVAPGIGELGKGAGKLLAITAGIAYVSTIVAGLIAYVTSAVVLPNILEVGSMHLNAKNPEEALVPPLFKVDMPPVMGVMTALLLAFTLGLGIAAIKGDTLKNLMNDFQQIVEKLIPVTLRHTKKYSVHEGSADFVIPLCATIHLSGSTVTLVSCSMAVMMLNGMNTSFGALFPFILMLGITMVAAPGVPGGAVMAALGLLQSMLHFDPTLLSLMIALYLAQDSFGTACNVTGDGAIALMVNKISGHKLTPQE